MNLSTPPRTASSLIRRPHGRTRRGRPRAPRPARGRAAQRSNARACRIGRAAASSHPFPQYSSGQPIADRERRAHNLYRCCISISSLGKESK